jgi:membrane protein implicated in regulation of membrane protease activity
LNFAAVIFLLYLKYSMNTRLIIAIVTSLIDEIIIVALILWVLPRFGIHIPWWGLALVIAGFVIYAVTVFTMGSRILKKKPVAGLSDMLGMEGKTTGRLDPDGFVKIEGELWEAKSERGVIEAGAEVVVVAQEGLKLVVKTKAS